MNETTPEAELADYLQALYGLTRTKPTTAKVTTNVRMPDGQAADAVIRIQRPGKLALLAAQKPRLRTRNEAAHAALQIKRLAKRRPEHPILFAPWIGDHVGEALRAAGVFYLDLEGNAYLWAPPGVAIDIRGRRPQHPHPKRPGRLIEATGLKVIHLILNRDDALERPYRWIAEQAGVALGSVATVVKELRQGGYVRQAARRAYRVVDRRRLMDLFVQGYGLKLRPACLIDRYRHRDGNPDRVRAKLERRLRKAGARWALTGGQGAWELTRHLRTEELTIFVDPKGHEALRQEGLIVDRRAGNVVLLDYFAPMIEATDHEHLATPLLVYAELLEQQEPRALETAEMILERHLLTRDA